jgi:hypothetical protein
MSGSDVDTSEELQGPLYFYCGDVENLLAPPPPDDYPLTQAVLLVEEESAQDEEQEDPAEDCASTSTCSRTSGFSSSSIGSTGSSSDPGLRQDFVLCGLPVKERRLLSLKAPGRKACIAPVFARGRVRTKTNRFSPTKNNRPRHEW